MYFLKALTPCEVISLNHEVIKSHCVRESIMCIMITSPEPTENPVINLLADYTKEQ